MKENTKDKCIPINRYLIYSQLILLCARLSSNTHTLELGTETRDERYEDK